MSTSSTGLSEGVGTGGSRRTGGTRSVRRLVAVVVALLSVFGVSVAAPAGAAQLDGGGSWSASDEAASYAPAKGDPSIWPKPSIVQTNLSAAESQQRVEDCPLSHLCVRNQEADGLWSAYALYYCLEPGQYYELTNFTGTVYAQNSQNVTARFLRADNSVVDTIGPNTGKNIYWNPVWKIDPC
ncbi:hypothetical protein ACFO6V_02745 [Promicromonospora alba]|uniref:Peptidase inhibitor family I36 n=1 Tax=Promicromonospora alba TaxID=1616110 RepID=A0ABV9HDG4_9MICO